MTMSSSILRAVCSVSLSVCLSCLGAAAVSVGQSPLSRVQSRLGLWAENVSESGHTNVDHEACVIRKALQPIWNSLAKNQHGEVNSEQARLVLKRYFGQRLGWKIASLEANDSNSAHASEQCAVSSGGSGRSRSSGNGDNSSAAAPAAAFSAAVDADLDAYGSMSIGGVAGFAKAIKGAIARMERKRLMDAYKVLDLPLEAVIHSPDADRVVDAYVASLVLGPELIKPDLTGVPFEVKAKQVYSGWSDTQLWLRDVRRSEDYVHRDKRSPFQADAGKSFSQVERVVQRVQEGFGRFQDTECRRLRDSLLAVQENATGMVRLSEFYRRGFETGFQFVEKAEYLQQLGALDTTGSEEPRVLVANYVLSEANCLSEAEEWSVCCINECDSYLEHLEVQVAAPVAAPERIADIANQLLFAVNDSALLLTSALRKQLEELSLKHGGMVPLHSQDFAAWLHVVFPSVCPRPFPNAEAAAEVPKANLTDVLMRPQGMRKYIDYMQRRQDSRERRRLSSQYSLQALLVQEDDVMEQWEELLFLPEALPDAAQEFANALRQGVLTLLGIGLLFLAIVDTVRRCLGMDCCLGYHANFLCLAM